MVKKKEDDLCDPMPFDRSHRSCDTPASYVCHLFFLPNLASFCFLSKLGLFVKKCLGLFVEKVGIWVKIASTLGGMVAGIKTWLLLFIVGMGGFGKLNFRSKLFNKFSLYLSWMFMVRSNQYEDVLEFKGLMVDGLTTIFHMRVWTSPFTFPISHE